MLVLIADGGFKRGPFAAQMIEIAGSAAESVADVTQGLTFGKLTKEHRHQMRPACIAFLMFIALVDADQLRKGKPV